MFHDMLLYLQRKFEVNLAENYNVNNVSRKCLVVF